MSEQRIMKPRKVEAKLEEEAQEKETIEETNEIQNELDNTPLALTQSKPFPKKSSRDTISSPKTIGNH